MIKLLEFLEVKDYGNLRINYVNYELSAINKLFFPTDFEKRCTF